MRVWLLRLTSVVLAAGASLAVPVRAAQTPAAPPAPPVRYLPSPEWVSQHWNLEEGLPQSSVTDIAQTPDGYIWASTFGGLTRFDGVRFRIFDMSEESGLSSNRINALLTGRDGTLWVGGDGGLSRYEALHFEAVPLGDGIDGAGVITLAEAADGAIWVGAQRGVAVLRDGRAVDGPWHTLAGPARLTAGAAGRVWIQTPSGLYRWDGARLERIEINPNAASGNPAIQVREAEDGAVVVSRWQSLWRRDPATGTWAGGPLGLGASPQHMPAVYLTRAGGLRALTSSGAFVWRDGGWHLVDTLLALPADRVRVGFEDRDGALWIGTDRNGLYRLRRGRVAMLGAAQGTLETSVVPILRDRAGTLWSGHVCGGVVGLPADPAAPVLRPFGGCIWALAEDRGGDLWAGTFGGGIARISGGRVVARYTRDQGLSGNGVNALFVDRDGALWVGSQEGLDVLRDGRVTQVARRADIGGVNVIRQARDGALWIGASGLTRLAGDARRTLGVADGLPDAAVRAIYEDADGAIWIGTYGGGLARLRDGRVVRVTRRHGLADDTISAIIEDARGRFWMNGNGGISIVSRAALDAVADGRATVVEPVVLGPAQGMRNREGNGGGQPAGWLGPDGHVFLPTIAGVAVVDTALPPAPSPVALLESVTVHGRLMAPGAVVLRPGDTNVQFTYTAPAFEDATRVRFRVLLEGFDPAWTDVGPRREAIYTNLRPGRYRLRVVAKSPGSDWGEQGVVYALTVPPRFYQTAAFQTLTAAVALGAIVLLIHLSGRRVRKRADHLAALVAEKSRAEAATRQINTELERALTELRQTEQVLIEKERLSAIGQMAGGVAHDLNNALAPVLGYADLLRRTPGLDAMARKAIENIHLSATDAVAVVRRLVGFARRRPTDATYPPVDVRTLVQQVADLTRPRWRDEAMAQGATIQLVLELAPVPAVTVDETDLREALVNLVFNAVAAMPNGGRLTLGTATDGAQVSVTVADTGQGMTEEVRRRCFEPFFTTKGRAGTGLGLAMVAGAVERCDGTIRVESAPGRGTTFTIAIPAASVAAPAAPQTAAPPADARPLRVLVVDDEPMVRDLTESYLRELGHTCDAVADGREAFDRFIESRYDVVITDATMPHMSGRELAERLHAFDPTVPIVMCTGNADAGEALLPPGVIRLLLKPASLDDFAAALAVITRRG